MATTPTGKLINQLYKGEWSALTKYTIGDIIIYNGSSYICVRTHTNHIPPNDIYWALLAQRGTNGQNGLNGEVTLNAPQTLTAKIYQDPVLNGNVSGTGVDTDVALTGNSDVKIASQKAVKTYVDNNLSSLSVLFNALINGGCQVAQKLEQTYDLTTSLRVGQVDKIAAKGVGTISAGTINQISNSTIGTTGYALKLAGVTITGSGEVYATYRIEAKDAAKFKNLTASFSVRVLHDVGSAINYSINVRKATVADNFSAVTSIVAGSPQSVASATGSLLKQENVSMGDCSNGIEIEVKVACGAIITKNFQFTEFQFNQGTTVKAFQPKSYIDDYSECLRYLQILPKYGEAWFQGGNQFMFNKKLLPKMRIVPVLDQSKLGAYKNSAGAPGASEFQFWYPTTAAAITWGTPPTSIATDHSSDDFINFYNGNGATPSLGTTGQYYSLRFGTGSIVELNADLY